MRSTKSLRLVGLLTIAVLGSVPNWSFGQVPRAQIVGTVTDPSGAAVPEAEVTLENELTGIKQSTRTNDTGSYTFSYLDSGTFRLEVQRSGFITTIYTGVRLQLAEKKLIDLTLRIGEVKEAVEVSAHPAVVETESSTVGQVVSQAEVVGMPLNGRDWSQLATLMPGIQLGGTFGGDISAQFGTAVSVEGTSSKKNTYTWDGVDNTYNFFNGPAQNPSIDSIQEVRIDRSLFSAEFGRGGAQLHVVTKQGTSEFHGAAWDFYRGSALNAGNYVNHEKDNLLRNQFGANLGGPILKKKLFFFFNWEGQRQRQNFQGLGSVLTDKMRGGDFSEFPRPVIDPQTKAPFTGNIIPPARLNAVMVDRVNSLLPEPTGPGIINNLFRTILTTTNWNQYTGRMDYQLSQKDSLFFRVSALPRSGLQQPLGPAWIGGTEDYNFFNMGVGWTRTWSTKVVTETRFGFHRENVLVGTQRPAAVGLKEPTLPIKALGGGVVDHLGSYIVSEFDAFGQQGNPIGFVTKDLEFAQNVSIYKGNHLVKAGFSGIKYDMDTTQAFTKTTYPIYIYAGAFTGVAAADMMLGLPTTVVGFLTFNPKYTHYGDYAFFVQDDWKVSHSLTLNFGLRYDLQTVPSEERNQWGNFSTGLKKIVMAGATVDNPAAIKFLVDGYRPFLVAGSASNLPSRTLVFGDHNNFAPRFGFAWRPFRGNKTSLRGGYGIFYFRPDGNITNNQIATVPFGGRLDVFNDPASPNPFTADDPYRGATPAQLPTPSTFLRDPHLRTPYIEQLSFSIQRELPWQMVADMTFQDQHTLKYERGWNVNQPPPGPGSITSRRPFQDFAAINGTFHDGKARYDSLELSVRKTSPHYTFQWSHTWAKNITSGPVLDTFRRELFRGPESYVPHVDKLHFVVDLPLGKGMRWLNSGGVVDAVLGGWTVSGIAILYQSGDPLTITWSGDTANVGVFSVRPDRVGSGKLANPTPQKWFDTSAFVAPTPGTFGNSGTGILFGPSRRFFDFGVYKGFRFGERVKLQFRTEMFNVFNHPNLSDPRTDASSFAFGQILTKDQVPRVIQLALRVTF